MTNRAMAPERRLSATDTHLLPEMRPQGTRGDILVAALRLFAEKGYAGASLRDIATACSIKAATVYSHYPAKEHILAELCRLSHAEHVQNVRNALLAAPNTPQAQVAALVRAHVKLHTSYPMLAVVANGELHHLSNELGARTFELRNQSIQILIDVIQRGVDLGAFDVPDVWLATAAIGGMGLRVAYWFDPDKDFDADEVAQGYIEFAWRILKAEPEDNA